MEPYSKQELLLHKKAIIDFIGKHPSLPVEILDWLLARIDLIDAFKLYSA